MPGRSPVSPQGTGRMVRDQNEPKFTQKSPGVGFWHALACQRKRVCVACAELSATKKNEQLGMGVIYSKENPKIYHYTHARSGAARVSVSGASDTSQMHVRRDERVGPISGSCAPATQACCMPCCMSIRNGIAWHAGKTACTKHASICVCAAGQASSLPGSSKI